MKKKASPAKRPARRPALPAPPDALLADALATLGEGVLLAEVRWQRGGLRIVYANDSLCAMTGYAPTELAGQLLGKLHADRVHLSDLRRWHRRMLPGQVFSGEGYLACRNGGQLYAAWTFSPVVKARGRVTHVAATYRDMAAKRRLQDELVHSQRLDAVGRLAGGVAHDFNNLLAVINGYCEILGSKPAVRRQAAREVEEIHRAGRHAAGLVRQLLAFSRRQALDPKVVSLNQLVRDNADILAKLLRPDKALALSLGAVHDHVRVDRAQLQQVLLNLVLNARDALRAGGETTIQTRQQTVPPGQNRRLNDMPPGRYVVLAVHDNGIGMDEATRSHLFEPFFTTKETGKGTGLGLALVYGVVQQSEGHILVHSAPGKGATFEIFLPEVREALPPPDAALGALPATNGTETILVVEEDTVVRKMVAGILTSDGYRVLDAGSPGEAQSAARAHGRPVHLLVLDPGPPGGDREKLARALHAVHAGLRVLVTSGTDPRPLDWLAANAQGTLAKPFALSELLRAVRSLLDGKGVPVAPPHFTAPL